MPYAMDKLLFLLRALLSHKLLAAWLFSVGLNLTGMGLAVANSAPVERFVLPAVGILISSVWPVAVYLLAKLRP